MKVTHETRRLVDKALDRRRLEEDELRKLIDREISSVDRRFIMAAADHLTRSMADNQGVIGAQIGLNVEPCSANCAFCSLAACNELIKSPYRLEPDEVVERTRRFIESGANYVSLMTTADYPFREYCRISSAVRKIIPSGMMLSANIGDFGAEEATELKRLGYGRVYHVLRLREGIDTDLNPEDRLKTIEAVQAENLELAFCIEPIGPEHSDRELVERILLARRYEPTTCAVMRRIPLAGTRFEGSVRVSELRIAHILSVLRLAFAATETKTFYIHEPSLLGLTAGANLICAEKAANPRELTGDKESLRGWTVERCAELLSDAEFDRRREYNYPGTWFKGETAVCGRR